MKLNELENIRTERAQALMNRVNALMTHAAKRNGTDEARAESIGMLRMACEAWDANDELSVHIQSVKSQINIPSLGMSVADAELWLHGLQHKRAFLQAIVDTVQEREPESEVSEETGETLPAKCQSCGEDWSPPIDMDLAYTLLAEVDAEITRLTSAVERASCSIETTWKDRTAPRVEAPGQSGIQVVGEVILPMLEQPQIDPTMLLFQQQLVQQPQVAPPVQQQPVQSFQVMDPTCPVCVSQGRLALEKHWLATKGDTIATLELGLVHGVIPQNMTPQLMQMHFDDHAKASDHGLA